MLLRNQFNDHKTTLQSLRKELGFVQKDHREAYRRYATQVNTVGKKCDELLRDMPGLDTQIYVHVIGVPKALKTSYVLDLYKSPKLAEILDVKDASNSEHTACPCLITLTDAPTTLEKCGLDLGDSPYEIGISEFHQFYQVPADRVVDGGYLLKVNLSRADADANAPTFSVIEYPGIEDSDEAEIKQKDLHDVFQADMMHTMRRYPGIVVACFETNVRLPNGHPLIEYKNFLAQYNQHVRPPLVLSLNGVKAVAGFCGNTNVLNDIGQYKAFKMFDLKIQLINPNPHNTDRYRLSKADFPNPGPHVLDWIQQLSDYQDIERVKTEIDKDGGVSFSRDMLAQMTQQAEIRDIVDRIYLTPWLEKAKQVVEAGQQLLGIVRSYDYQAEIKQKIRTKVTENDYKTIEALYQDDKRSRPNYANSSDYQKAIKEFWITLVAKYFQQFYGAVEPQKPGRNPPEPAAGCLAIATTVVDDLLKKLNGNSTKWQFLYAKDEDADLIMLNLLRFHLSACVMRGDKDFSDC